MLVRMELSSAGPLGELQANRASIREGKTHGVTLQDGVSERVRLPHVPTDSNDLIYKWPPSPALGEPTPALHAIPALRSLSEWQGLIF